MALSHAGILALIVFMLGGAGYVFLSRSLNHEATASVAGAARVEAERIEEAGRMIAPPDNDLPSASAIRVALFMPNGSILGERDEVPSWLRPTRDPTATVRALGERVGLATVRVTDHGRLLATVVAGRSMAPEARLLSRVRLVLLLGGLAAALASMLAGWFLAGRATRPVRAAYDAQANFAADASHELRTPLAFIRSGVEVLADRDPDLGREVLGEVEYLASLTDRLLTLARADSDVLDLGLLPAPVESLCRRAVARSEAAFGIRAALDAEHGITALADPIALEAALDAILENVGRYGGGAAEVACRRLDGKVIVSVTDHGPGLSDEARARAFERFFRADAARNRAGGGAGLGLSLARSLVEAQRGRLWLEGTPGGGLTVALELPLADSQTPAAPKPRPD